MTFDREKHIVSRRGLFTERFRQRVEQRGCAGTDFPVLGFLGGMVGASAAIFGLNNERRRLIFAISGYAAGFFVGTMYENHIFKDHSRVSRYC